MRVARLLLPYLAVLAACDTKAKEQYRTLAHADSLRTDSLVSIKNDLLNEVMASTQFVNDLNGELAQLKSRSRAKLSTKLTAESDMAAIKEERATVVQRIREIVARLDSSEARVSSLRRRAASLAARDTALVGQVTEFEKTIADLRQTVSQQKAEYEQMIAGQKAQIALLTSRVDTITQENVRLETEKSALTDTVTQLVTEKNTAYYVIGSKDELIRQGVLVEEGRKRLLLLGSRPLSAARELDPAKFTKIDRQRDRVITFPEGTYTIFSRQNPAYAVPMGTKDNKMTGGLKIEQPDRFWESSKFLIIIKA
jgi:hypothetical protein